MRSARPHGSRSKQLHAISFSRTSAIAFRRSVERRISPSFHNASESRCCPFLDFGIDVRGKGGVIGLRLTGPGNVKPFLEEEFGVTRARASGEPRRR